MLKHFDEIYSGWGTEGYTMKEATKAAEDVKSAMRGTKGIKEIKVEIEPMFGGKYRVRNTSTYESDWG